MGNRDVCTSNGAHTSLYVTVTYQHKEQRWHGGYTINLVDGEGELTTMSAVTIEFGPFDSSTEVGYWLASLARPVRSMQPKSETP